MKLKKIVFTKEQKKYISQLENEKEMLNRNLNDRNLFIRKIDDILDLSSYATESDIISAIGNLKGAARVYKEMKSNYEGRENELVARLTEENSKLWYFMRIALKDESAQKTDFKPGDRRRPDMLGGIVRPFRDNSGLL